MVWRRAIGIAFVVCLVSAATAAAADKPINIERWPEDVPCDKLKKHADGTYEMTVPWARFYQVHTGGKWKNTRETQYWDQKCKGKTQ
jgi:hypothetical protein